MLDQIASWFGGIPAPGVIAILVVLVIQVGLQVTALINLARRRSVLFDRKWVWVIVIIGGALLGAIVYWAVARTEAAADESSRQVSAPRNTARSKQAIEKLYGSKDTK